VPAYRNDGTEGDFDKRAGDHHDGMEWFGLGAEATTNEGLSSFFLHANGGGGKK
jgi:hypothetical protein